MLARQVATVYGSPYSGLSVFLGLLESKDLRRLSRNQRIGLSYFWDEYFAALGTKPYWTPDGSAADRVLSYRIEVE